nr:transferase [Azoarcus sp. KH32C]
MKDLVSWCGLLAQGSDGQPYVVDANGQRALQFDALTIQSQMALDDPNALALDYTRTMMGFLLFHPAPRHIAMIGLGGGSLVKYCLHAIPDASVTAVEISPEVIALRDEFGIPPDGPRLRILCGDGADYVRDTDEAPDILLVDGFDLVGMPPQLCSAEFYDYCYEMLADGGMMVVNLWSGDSRYGVYASRIRDSFRDRFVSVRSEEDTNRILFASKDRHFPPRRTQLLERARALDDGHPIGLPSLAQRIQHRLDRRRAFGGDNWPAANRGR